MKLWPFQRLLPAVRGRAHLHRHARGGAVNVAILHQLLHCVHNPDESIPFLETCLEHVEMQCVGKDSGVEKVPLALELAVEIMLCASNCSLPHNRPGVPKQCTMIVRACAAAVSTVVMPVAVRMLPMASTAGLFTGASHWRGLATASETKPERPRRVRPLDMPADLRPQKTAEGKWRKPRISSRRAAMLRKLALAEGSFGSWSPDTGEGIRM